MLGANEGHSEVAHLLAQISAEYEAAKLGLSGLSSGSSRHDIITARMERMCHLHQHLQRLIGEPQATRMLADQLCPLEEERRKGIEGT